MIYFVRCGKDGPVKIGYTSTGLTARLNFLQVGCPWQLEVLGTIEGSRSDERALHKQFAHLHLRGEWFHPTAELMALIGTPAEPKAETRIVADLDIKALRRVLRLPQTALANLIGVDQGTVSAWETGKSRPTRAAQINLQRLIADQQVAE